MQDEIILGIDAGGTFTDFVCIQPGNPVSIKTHKILSTPAAPEKAILQGIADLRLGHGKQGSRLHIIHGSTVATNAALEGKTSRTAFITNRGFADMLTIARQVRPELYALEFEPQPVPVPEELCLETGGRIGADGAELDPLTDEDLEALREQLRVLKPEAIAINLLFSYIDDSYERRIEDAIKQAFPGLFVSRSSRVLPEYKEYERGIATWLNASLGPVVSGYIHRLRDGLDNASLQIMQSSGETLSADVAAESAVNLLLSGPAGGLQAVNFISEQCGFRRLVSFDMGGTSTDVALLEGAPGLSTEGHIAGYPVAVPMVEMHTIGAGGGSIAYIDAGGMLQVGPASAGADPGPACYGNGGREATVTDANLVLGRISPQTRLANNLKLDLQLARDAVGALAQTLNLSIEETAAGIVSIANELMAEAVRMISINRGHDPAEYVLASFGGAGGLHVCSLADALGIPTALVPVHCGVLSALGMGVAPVGRQFSRTVNITLLSATEYDQSPETFFDLLNQSIVEEFSAMGMDTEKLKIEPSIDMRYAGQSYTLNVPWRGLEASTDAFHELHSKRYGYRLQGPLQIVNIRCNASFRRPGWRLPPVPGGKGCNKTEPDKVFEPVGQGNRSILVERTALSAGDCVPGPAVIVEQSATTFVDASWMAEADELGNLVLRRMAD